MNINTKITIRDVARECGVSIMTVSRAFHDSTRISAATRQKVFDTATKLKYQPDMSARGLRGGSTRSVGIITSNPSESKIVRQISEKLLAGKYVTYIADSLGDPELTESAVREFIARRVDAIVIDWRLEYRRISELLGSLETMVMFTYGDEIPYNCDCCFIDQRPAIRNIMNYLISQGRRNIYFVGRAQSQMSRCIMNVMAECGLDNSAKVIDTSSYPGKPAAANHYDALMDQLKNGLRVDALFAYNDVSAAQLCKCVRDFGLRVPEDIAVIGCGNLDLAAFCNPPIASIANNEAEVGKCVRDLLINRLNDPKSPKQRNRVESDFIKRESAG